jgi:hypothetical protein
LREAVIEKVKTRFIVYSKTLGETLGTMQKQTSV